MMWTGYRYLQHIHEDNTSVAIPEAHRSRSQTYENNTIVVRPREDAIKLHLN
jgi:hypothetical protein